MDNENIIDLGSWKTPTSWSDVTLKQYQEISKYYSDKDKDFDVRDVIHILCNKTVDEVNMLPMEFTERIMEKLLFLQEKPQIGDSTVDITVDGVKYHINIMEHLKTGEYLASDQILHSDPFNFAAILAILCRKDGEIYDSKFEAEVFPKRLEMFENIPMIDGMRVINFFIQRYITLRTPSLLSSHLMEAINLTRKDIETSVKNGEHTRLWQKLQMIKLKKLEKSIKSI